MLNDICSSCKYNCSSFACNYCTLNSNYEKYNNYITNFQSLINKDNIQLFKEHILTEEEYQFILDKIILKGINNLNINPEDNILDKITTIARQYAKFIYVSDKDCYGSYIYNLIKINPNHSTSKQISTVIHELCHHLVTEILKESLMLLLNAKDNYIIDSFIMFIVNMHKELKMADEYIAHTCENYFIPKGCASYSSVFKLLIDNYNNNNAFDDDGLKLIFAYSKSIAADVIYILNNIIDDKIKEEILLQFKIDNNIFDHEYKNFEKITAVSNKEKILSINDVFILCSEEIISNNELYDDLKEFYYKFNYYESLFGSCKKNYSKKR